MTLKTHHSGPVMTGRTNVKGLDFVMGAGRISEAIRKLAPRGQVDRTSLLTLSLSGTAFQISSGRGVATAAFDAAKPRFGRASVEDVTREISKAGAFLESRANFRSQVKPAFNGGALQGIHFFLHNYTTGRVE